MPMPSALSLIPRRNLRYVLCTLATLLYLSPISAQAQTVIGHYRLSSEKNVTISGGQEDRLPQDAIGQRLEFEFEAENYFGPQNVGHVTVGVRGNSIAVGGRGVVIGNLTLYGFPNEFCQQTSAIDVVAIESYWADNNCVYGGTTQSVALDNRTRYKVTVESIVTGRIAYGLYKLDARQNWVRLSERSVNDKFNDKVYPALAGWWIGEVFSTHHWYIDFYNVKTEILR